MDTLGKQTYEELKQRVEQREMRTEKLARVFRITSYIPLVGIILFLGLAFVFTQFFVLLVVLSMFCGLAFMVLKGYEDIYQSDYLLLSQHRLNSASKKLDKIEKDLKKKIESTDKFE